MKTKTDLTPGTATAAAEVIEHPADTNNSNSPASPLTDHVAAASKGRAPVAELEVMTAREIDAGDALARGMLAGMCANNIDQAKRMLQIGNLTMCEHELHKALKKIMQMKKA